MGNFNFTPSTVSTIGGAAQSLFSGIGQLQSAGSYREAARIAGENVDITAESSAIKVTQSRQKNERDIGGQQADIAGAGFSSSGSALDILRSSTEQGALSDAMIRLQGIVDVNAYKAQQTSYLGQAAAADASGVGGIIGAVFGVAAAVVGVVFPPAGIALAAVGAVAKAT